jgi:hypothetical protein
MLDVDTNDHEKGKVYVRFYTKAVEDQAASLEAGHPKFRDVDYIEKYVPGDPTTSVCRRVTEADRQEFGRQYKAWKEGQEEKVEGLPLAEWPAMTRSLVEELAHFKIKTVEQLSHVSDANLAKIGPYQSWKQKAKDFLANAKDHSLEQKLRAENDELKNRISVLEKTVAKQNDVLEHVDEKPAEKHHDKAHHTKAKHK